MQVILLEKIRNLGELGDSVTVANGYGRNYLLPKGKAVSATKANTEKFETRRAELVKKAAEELSQYFAAESEEPESAHQDRRAL